MEDQHFDYGEQKELSENKFLPPTETQKFRLWSTDPNGKTGNVYSDTQSVMNLTDVNNGVVDLYAQWTNDNTKYTLIYDANGGEGTMDQEICTFGKLHTLKRNTFTNKGYHLKKLKEWNTDPKGINGTSYQDMEQIIINQNTLSMI